MNYPAQVRERMRNQEHVPDWILDKLGLQVLKKRKQPALSSLMFAYDELLQDHLMEDLEEQYGWDLLFLASKLLVARMHGHEPSYAEDAEEVSVTAVDVEGLYNSMLERYEVPYNAETGAPDLFHLRERLLPSHRAAPDFDDAEWPILFRNLKRDGVKAWANREQFKKQLEEAFESPHLLEPFNGLWAPPCVSQIFLAKMQSRFGEVVFREYGYMDYVDASRVLRIDVGAGVTGGALEYVHSAMLALGITSPYHITANEMRPIKVGLQKIARASLNQEPIPGLHDPDYARQTWYANSMLLEIEGLEARRCVYSCQKGHVDMAETGTLPMSVDCEDCGELVGVKKFTLLHSLAHEPEFVERVLELYTAAVVT
jgi:hypothetical protein